MTASIELSVAKETSTMTLPIVRMARFATAWLAAAMR
jgi:hypothetical protein